MRVDEKHHQEHNHHQHHHHQHKSYLNSLSSPEDESLLSSYGSSFETMNNTHIVAQIGGTAILPCIVETSSTQATVTWIRRSDYQLLTGWLSEVAV